GAGRAMEMQVVGGVHALGGERLRVEARAQLHRGRPLVADGEQRMDDVPPGPQRVEEVGAGLAQSGGVRHEPACVDLARHGPRRLADDARIDPHADAGHAASRPGKFIASTKMLSKSGCAASETWSMRRARASARARSTSDMRASSAPSAAALPT